MDQIDPRIIASLIAAITVFISFSLYKRHNKEMLDYMFLLKISLIGAIIGFSGYHVSTQNFSEPIMTIPFKT